MSRQLAILLSLCASPSLAWGAAPVVEAAISPARAVTVALADAKKLPKDDAPYFRYFRVTTEPKFRDDFLVAFCLHINLLSTEGVIKWPVMIAPDVLRIDVRDYGWDKNDNRALLVFEKLAGIDFTFRQPFTFLEDTSVKEHWPGGKENGKSLEQGRYNLKVKKGQTISQPAVWLGQKEIDELRLILYTEVPVVGAEWFFVQSARQTSLTNDEKSGVGYNDFLGLKTRDDFFRLTGTDPKVAKKVFAEWRAVVVKSGISKQNRQIVALGGANGKAWITLDTFVMKGKGIAKRNLREGEFAHQAEELIGRLGNGLWVTALVQAVDANGVKAGDVVASAPDKIGPDDSALNRSRDTRVHANLSCIRCHWVDKDGLKPIDDWARKTFRETGVLRLIDSDKKVLLELQSQYLRDLDEVLDDERILYVRGVRRATTSKLNPKGLTMSQAGKLYAAAWDRYVEDEVSLADAARELGVTEKALKDGISKHVKARGGTDLVLAGFLDAQKLERLEWEDSYALAMTLALGLDPPEIIKKEDKKK